MPNAHNPLRARPRTRSRRTNRVRLEAVPLEERTVPDVTPTVINFDDLPAGTIVTTQYQSKGAIFSGDPSYPNQVIASTDASQPNSIGAPTPGDPVGNPYIHPLYVDFTSPVNNLEFTQIRDDASPGTQIAQVAVYTKTGAGPNVLLGTVPIISTGGSGLVDLSSYKDVTRIEITNVTDPAGILYDDFQFTKLQEFKISVTSFIPSLYVPNPSDISGSTVFAGDNRGFDAKSNEYRTRSVVTVIPDQSASASGLKDGSIQNSTGLTLEYSLPALKDGKLNAKDNKYLLAADQAGTGGMHVDVTRTGPQEVQVHMYGGASNPLVSVAPSIDWNFTITINVSGSSPTYKITGTWDGFPAAEVYVNDQPIYLYSPGKGPFGIKDLLKLYPGIGDVSVNASGVLQSSNTQSPNSVNANLPGPTTQAPPRRATTPTEPPLAPAPASATTSGSNLSDLLLSVDAGGFAPIF